MWPKGMEDLAAFIAREIKRAAAEKRKRDEYIPLQKDSERQSKRQKEGPLTKLSES